MDLYRQHILDHAKNPRFAGVLDPCDIDHEQHNHTCGDFLHLTMRVDDNNMIDAIAWDGEGCAISQAAASMLGEVVVGKSLKQVQDISSDDVLALLQVELAPNRLKCAVLSLNALHQGIESYKKVRENTKG
ncbi:MAG: iron-sulfur cluster assembly scaffold protein [Aggregatilineales bacterium]